jgi:hypothetical protein
MKDILFKIGYSALAVWLFSCNFSQEGTSKKIVRQWLGKEIILPQEIEYKIMGRDTMCPELWNKPYKILTYADSVGCTGCQLGIPQWQQIINTCKIDSIDVGFLFVIQSPNYADLGYELLYFDYPIIYDKHKNFDKFNHFPPLPYRTFLLDKDNKVILVGSPINNPRLLEMYINVMNERESRN